MSVPVVSIIMSAYNVENYLKESIDSILQQTFTDFEFIIINDASSDRSAEIIRACKDPRIVLIENEVNIGLTKSLNKGMLVAAGEFIARMDADDISHSHRLERQVNFMRSNPDVGLSGSWVEIFGVIKKRGEYPVTHDEIKFTMLSHNAFSHPTVMWRKQLQFFYNENYTTAQDYELFSKAIHRTKTANIPEVLLFYREHDNQVTQTKSSNQQTAAQNIKLDQLKYLELAPDDQETIAHLCLFDGRFKIYRDDQTLKDADVWMYKLFQQNQSLNVYDQSLLIKFWKSKLFGAGLYELDMNKWKILNRSWCKKMCRVNFADTIKLYIKCILHWKVRSS